MGLFSQALTQLPADSANEDPTVGGEVSKGWSRGLRNTGSGFMEAGALGAEALGLPTVQQRLRTGAKSLRDDAAGPEFAPEAATFDEAKGFGQTLRWGAGKVGELGPPLVGAVAGGLVTKNPFIGQTAALAPMSVGEIAQRQYDDPTIAAQPLSERGPRALAGGTADAVLTNLAFGKLMPGTKITGVPSLGGAMARSVGEGAVTGGVGMASGETVKQLATDPSAPLNKDQILDAGIGGAVTVGAMHVPVGGVSYLKGNSQALGEGLSSARTSIKDRLATARESVGSTASAAAESPAGQKIGSFADDLGDRIGEMVTKGREKYDDVADKIRSGELLGTTKEAVTGMTPERIREAMDLSDSETVKTVTKWGNDLLGKAGIDDAKRAEISDALANAGTRAGQVAMAGLKKASDLSDRARTKIDAMATAFKDGYNESKFKPTSDTTFDAESRVVPDDFTQIGTTKKSDDYSGVRRVILSTLEGSGLKERRPELFDDAGKRDVLTHALGTVVERMQQGRMDSAQTASLIAVLGDDITSVLQNVHKVVGDANDPQKFEKFNRSLLAARAVQKRSSGLIGLVRRSYVGDPLNSSFSDGLEGNVQLLIDHARGSLDKRSGEQQREYADGEAGAYRKPTAREDLVNEQVAEFYESHFGDKADTVRTAVEKEAKVRKGVDEGVEMDAEGRPIEHDDSETSGAGRDPLAGKFDEQGNRLEAAPTDIMRFGLSDPDIRGNSKSALNGNAMLENSRYAKQHLLDLKAKYPEHDVRFENLSGSDHGHIVVEQRADPGKFSDADLASMKHNTKDYPNSPSRLKVGGHNIDAVKVANAMRKKGYADFEGPGNETSALKTANAFKEGIAQLTEQFGQKIDVPDSAVIGKVGGKPLLWGDAKKLKGDTAENRMSKSGQADLATMRKEYKGANADERADLRDKVRKLVDFEKSRELGGDQDTPFSSQAASARSQRKAQRWGYESEPHDNSDGRFDDEGNLTRAGAQQMLEGDAHGGIDVLNQRDARDPLKINRGFVGPEVNDSKIVEQQRSNRTAGNSPRVTPEFDNGMGRSAVSADENPHLAAAAHGKDMDRTANMDGSPHFVGDKVSAPQGKARNALTMTIGDWHDAGEPEMLIDRAQTLLNNIDKLSSRDARRLTDLAGKTTDQAKLTLNNLARTYKDQIVAPGVRAESIKNIKGSTQPKNPVTFRDGKAVDTVNKTVPLEKAITKHQDYLDNPPEGYSTEKARGIIDWATTQKERVDAKFAETVKDGADADRQDQLSDMKSALSRLIKKAKSVIEGDESLADKEGSAPNPKAVAAKKAAFLERAASGDEALIKELGESTDAKGLQRAAEVLPPSKALDTVNARLSELVQDPDVAYGLGTKKYSLESSKSQGEPDAGTKLITRLAADRRSAFADAGPDGIYRQPGQKIPFSSIHEAEGLYVLDKDGAHSFIIPDELRGDAERRLTEYPAGRAADVLSIFAVQHALYDPKTTKFQSFGPDPRAPAGRLLSRLGILGDTGGSFVGDIAMTRVEGVKDRQLARYLGDTLAYAKQVLGHDQIEINWKRESGANKGKVGGGWFSAESTNPNVNNAQDPGVRQAIKDHITNVLGNSVRTSWANLTHAGEYTHAQGQGLIRLSVHALDPMSTAYHESLHAFFGQLRDGGAHDITSVLEKAASSEHVLAQLKERYKNEPGVLKQLADPEERAAYMYQTWAVDPTFKVSIAAKNVFGRIADMIRNALGLWTNDQRALHIMDYFHSGEYAKNMSSISGVRHALMDSHRSQILGSAKAVAEPLGRLADTVLGTGSARLRDTGIPALNKLADAIKREGTKEGGDQGFIQASGVEKRQRLGALGNKLADYTPEQLKDALESLQRASVPASPEGRLAVRAIKGVLAETKAYMEAAGVEIGDLGPDYFPRVWDTHYISKNQQAFRDMLEPYIRSGKMTGTADQLIKNLATRDGNEFGIETREPGMQFKKERLLGFISHADAAQFMSKDLYGTLNSYITQATRKAEWTRRLGGGKLEDLMLDAKAQGATSEQIKTAEQYLKGIDGTLGDNINPHARRVMGNMIVYQNVRLLPMAAFSMLIDPNGVMVRGGTVSDAWKTFKRGISEIPQSYGRVAKSDRATELAELTGVIDSAILTHTMGDLYTQGMVGGTAQKLNNAFFKYNMVEGLNRSFRVGASEAAMSFMARHSDLKDSVHSRRWMAELGIQKGDIIKTADGRVALTEAEGLTKDQVQRVHAAVNQWVDGAILRPDAADKPIWMNDPRFALVSHLKQFVFSFQKTILERVAHEFKNGNYTPAMALASYVPVMMAADFVKGMVASGGGTPDWQAGWDIADYIEYGMQRAGLFGVGQFGLDVLKDVRHGNSGVFSLLGPTIEQARDGVEALGGHKQFGPLVLHALPANALYAHQFGKTDKAPPMFDD